MNIFILDTDHYKNAMAHCDKHVVKMIIEYAQLLSTAHNVLDGIKSPEGIYKSTHINHPCAVWARKTDTNYIWLYQLFCALCNEYTHRYNKNHKTQNLTRLLCNPPHNIEIGPKTPHPLCMPDTCKMEDSIESYRKYYNDEKRSFCTWKNREIPNWIIDNH